MGHRVVNLGVCLLNSNYNVRIVYQSIFSSCALNLRKKSNKADTNSIPPSINLTVLLTGGPGSTGKSLMVTTNSKNKYLFNCGEGLCRHVSMRESTTLSNVRVADLRNIFITHISWENIGGLTGTALNLLKSVKDKNKAIRKKDESSSNIVSLYGPKGIDKPIRMLKEFNSNESNLIFEKCDGEFTDHAINISSIVLHDAKSDSNLKRLIRSTRNSAFAYICKPKPVLPKVRLEKCVECGITDGSMVRKLKDGMSVTLDDGRVVTPDMVMENSLQDNRPFFVVDCPTLSFLPSLVDHPDLEEYMDTDANKSFMIIVHMTPSEVYSTDQYQSWMKRFPDSTHHMVLNESAWAVDTTRIQKHQAQLQLVDEQLFPTLHTDEPGKDVQLNLSLSHGTIPTQGKTVKGCAGLLFVYRGKETGFHVCEDHQFKDDIAIIQKRPEVQEAMTKLRAALPSRVEENERSFPEIVFLGTGSGGNDALRNQSCILIQLSKSTSMILDCGEDAYGQLYRFYGKEKAEQVLRNVKAIFVSHMHADHFLGLFTLIKERKKSFDLKDIPYQPLLVMAPIQFRRWFRFAEEIEPISHLIRCLHHQQDIRVKDRVPIELTTLSHIKQELGLLEYNPVEVIHIRNSYGLSFTHKNGFKITYSGDTKPCKRLIDVGKGSDILIHEATHEDLLADLASISNHSTFSQAIDIGTKMAAKHVILTHFSNRYSYMVPLHNLKLPSNLGVAFDNMIVTPTTLNRLPKVIPMLTAVFDEELMKLEDQLKRLRNS